MSEDIQIAGMFDGVQWCRLTREEAEKFVKEHNEREAEKILKKYTEREAAE